MSNFSKIKKFYLYFTLAAALLLLSGFRFQGTNRLDETATIFSYPLGFLDGQTYAPRINYENSSLIENTDYSVQNPDLSGSSGCFGVERRLLRHAGEDLYRIDGQTTNGAEVTAIADGIVIEYNPESWYPGQAIVIEHTLSPSGEKVYSVYMHLNNVQITQGQVISRGQLLGYVMYSQYEGNYPDFHNLHYGGDDSHLHFEIRYFPDAGVIYQTYNNGQFSDCDLGDKAGRGYTSPDIHPDNFPSPGAGYTDPSDFIASHGGSTTTETPTPTTPPTVLASSTFDDGADGWTVVNDAYAPVYHTEGGNPGGYISATDKEQGSYWYWRAPSKFYGDFSNAYGKTLIFDLKQSSTSSQADRDDVILVGAGLTLVYNTSYNPGTNWTAYNVLLHESAGWVNSASGQSATQAELQTVLAALGDLQIRGEYRVGPDTGSLDNVMLGGAPDPNPSPTPQSTATPEPCWCPVKFLKGLFCGQTASSNNNVGIFHLASYVQQATFDIELLYRVENEILSQTPQGQHYIDLYYGHGVEITDILRNDAALKDEAIATLELWEPNLQTLVDGQGDTVLISQAEVSAVDHFLSGLEVLASNDLRTTIQNERVSLNMQGLVGLTMSQAWAEIGGIATPTPTFTTTTTATHTPTNTPTFTPTFTPTNTPTNTSTSTPTFTPTPTPGASSNFPRTGILDNFNRANGAIGNNWSGYKTNYEISSNQLRVKSSGSNTDIYWSASSFGPDQEAYVTFSDLISSASEQDLLLKSQSASTWGSGVLEVWYDAPHQRVQVWTYKWPQGWVQRGADIPVTFVDGDTFGARARPDGTVEVYRNGELLATRDITAWPHYAGGGYIGMWFAGAYNARLDDFGGGTVSEGKSLSMPVNGPGGEIEDGQLNVELRDADVFWQGVPLGTGQAASVTFATLRTDTQAAERKPQSNGIWGEGVVEVLYDVAGQRIQVWVYELDTGWAQVGRDIAARFAQGDQFRALVRPDGMLELYRNGKLFAKQKIEGVTPQN